MYKFLTIFAVCIFAIGNTECIFFKKHKKLFGNIITEDVKPVAVYSPPAVYSKPLVYSQSTVYGPPSTVYGPPATLYGAPTTKAPEEPLLTKEDYQALFGAINEEFGFKKHLKNIKQHFNFIQTGIPEYQLRPELGFSQYNQIKYVPLVPVAVDVKPVAPVYPDHSSGSDSSSDSSKPYQ